MAKVIRDGKTFEIDDSDDSLAAARAKGYAPIITVTKNGSDTFDLNSDDVESVKAAFSKGYSDVNTFKNMPKHEGPGRLESFGQGVASSATLGHDDEISAGIGSMLGRDYDSELQRVRALKHERENAHAGYNLAGNLVGAVASPINKIPGASSIAGMALQGAVQGEGDSEAQDLAGLVKDAGKGGLYAGALGAGMKGAGYVVKKLPGAITGIGDDTAKYYMANHEAVDSARPIKDLSDDLIGDVGTFRRKLSNESTEGFNALKASGREASPEELAGIVEQQADLKGAQALTSKSKSLVSELNTLQKELKAAGVNTAEAAPKEESSYTSVFKKAGSQASEPSEGEKIPYDKIKSYIKQIDDEIDYKAIREGNASSRDRSLKAIRDNFDKIIKQDPDYARIMKGLAEKSSALEELGAGARNEKAADNMLKRVGNGKDPRTKEALANLDEMMGTNYGKEIQDSATKDVFTRENSRGSRNTLVAAGLGAALGSFVGIPPWISGGLSTAAGPVIDKAGREVYRKVLKTAAENPQALAKFQKVLDKAAQTSPAALVTTHQLLMKHNPSYKKAMGDE